MEQQKKEIEKYRAGLGKCFTFEQRFADFQPKKKRQKKKSLKEILIEQQEQLPKKQIENTQKYQNIIKENLKIVENKTSGCITSKHFPITQRFNIDENQTFREKKIVAYSLVTKGSSYTLFQQYIDQQKIVIYLTHQRYKSISAGIIHQGFRKLQSFLKIQCEKLITQLRYEEVRPATRYFLSTKGYLDDQQMETFRKFLCLIYGLHAVNITEAEASQLYRSILNIILLQMKGIVIKPAIKTPKIQPKKPEKPSQEKTGKWDQQLINFYELNQNFEKISKCFQKVHQKHQSLFTPQFLKTRFECILRHILKRIKFFSELKQQHYPKMMEPTNSRVRYLVDSPICKNLCLNLLTLRNPEEIQNQKKLYAIIMIINQKLAEFDVKQGYKDPEPVSHQPNHQNRGLLFYRPNEEDEDYKMNRFVVKPRWQTWNSTHLDCKTQNLSDQEYLK